jgi:hypothetical protein
LEKRMNQRWLWASFPVGAFALVLSASSCGGYESADRTGGTTGSGGAAASGGASTSGGAAASGGSATPSGGSGTTSGGATASGGDSGAGGTPEAPEAACEDGVPCGGDIARVWFAQDSCLPITGVVDLLELAIGCTEAEITSGTAEVTGNWTINADGSVSDNTTTESEVVFELERPCLDVSGTVTQCPNIGLPLTALGFDDVTCVDSETTAEGCTCTATATQQGGMGYPLGFNAATSGTSAVADNTVTVTGTGPAPLEYAYCVDGPFAIVTPKTQRTVGTINGTIVLQAQE